MSATGRSFEGPAGGIGDGGGIGVDAKDAEEIDVRWRSDFLPRRAAISGAQDSAVAPDEPANLIGVRGAGNEISHDAAGLDGPSRTGID